ncbi:MAG: bifunctional folylpolyglutamate synthase/dihydrofolate synthase, partial [Desulfobacteraceae bacterium]|nr:bifunctional folylpolyglutamate synthase/dihydrofolate synthase [Desulfobacteraceae bacterium]
VHVAGTNGKGSVASTLLAVLSRAGYRAGLYTSPHLSSVRERFRINDEYIPREEFARHATRIHDILAGRQITYFEFTTALALLWFADRQVDVAIMEVGLGGRLDATNVITPLVGVITNVSMDHEAYLGTTLEAVAGEKAGIVKPGVPVVAGVGNDASRMVVEATCLKQGADLYLLGRDFRAEPEEGGRWSYHPLAGPPLAGIEYRLQGGHQLANGAVALATQEILARKGLPVPESAIRAGLREVHWPGRLEHFELPAGPPANGARYRYLLDGAHNPAGVESLAAALGSFPHRQLILVWASMADKDVAPMLAAIAPLAHRLLLTKPAGERAATPEQLLAMLPEEARTKAECVPAIPAALDRAREIAAPDDLICVAGSLYLVGAARKLLLGELVADE